MAVKIVTDSTADIPPEITRELDITVVPAYVRFGDEVFRDGVDISHEQFYDKLASSPWHPTTSQPTPDDFTRVYNGLCRQADGIVSIHISAGISGTCNSANIGKQLVPQGCALR
jgi:DegV family protein with EDD domain